MVHLLSLISFDVHTLLTMPKGLSPRAGHPTSQLHLLHGGLFDVRCTGFYCNYSRQDFTDPIVPELAVPTRRPDLEPPNITDRAIPPVTGPDSSASAVGQNRHDDDETDAPDTETPLPVVDIPDLPTCPKCFSLLRPGVVWFGESLPKDTVAAVQDFIAQSDKIDLIMVIGTSAQVYPAAGYVDIARQKGARVAVVNLDRSDIPGEDGQLRDGDFFFEGDAGVIVPEILKPVIGEV